MKKEIIEIQEDFKIPDTDIVLEKGDKINILKEYKFNSSDIEKMVQLIVDSLNIENLNSDVTSYTAGKDFSGEVLYRVEKAIDYKTGDTGIIAKGFIDGVKDGLSKYK